MMLAHRQKLRFEQMLKKLLTEKKNVEKQKCMSSATTSWDPEELTEAKELYTRHNSYFAPIELIITGLVFLVVCFDMKKNIISILNNS